jgi:fructosamine-3-kinase
MALAQRLGRLPAQRARRIERLIARLPGLLGGVEHRPALIHGDLWGGNIIPGPTGLALIDPAISYSDREAELAYTELFGGFSASFYAGYQSAWPLDPGYLERRDLYNLYHLINHLNHFGESYGQHVDTVLRVYTG